MFKSLQKTKIRYFRNLSCHKIIQTNSRHYKSFCDLKQDTLKRIYISIDKHSIKPDKEVCIIKSSNGDTRKEIYNLSSEGFSLKDSKENFIKRMNRIFLPRDYPNSVKEGYFHFTKYAFICGTIFHIMNFLSTQALITSLSISVSRSVSLSISAGMNWVLKDGIGQIGSIFFATKYSHSIEMDLKKWRIISLWMYNLGILFDALTLLKPQYFIIIASTATLLRISAFIANSSSRTGINNHFCKENNITDLSNKHLAQNNISFIIGSLIGLTISTFIPMEFNVVFPTIIFLSMFHLISAHMSCLRIYLNDMNIQRAYYVAQEYIYFSNIPTPEVVNKKEKFFFKKLKNFNFCNYSFEKLIERVNDNTYVSELISIFEYKKFFVYLKKEKGNKHSLCKIYTFMKLDGESIDIFLAFLFSVKLKNAIDNNKISEECHIDIIKNELLWLDKIDKNELINQLKEKGWEINFNLLEEKYQRLQIIT